MPAGWEDTGFVTVWCSSCSYGGPYGISRRYKLHVFLMEFITTWVRNCTEVTTPVFPNVEYLSTPLYFPTLYNHRLLLPSSTFVTFLGVCVYNTIPLYVRLDFLKRNHRSYEVLVPVRVLSLVLKSLACGTRLGQHPPVRGPSETAVKR